MLVCAAAATPPRAAAARPRLRIKHAKQQHGPLPLTDQQIRDTHQQRHVGDGVSSFIPPKHTQMPTLSSSLIPS